MVKQIQAAQKAARKAIEATYFGTLTVTELQKVKNEKSKLMEESEVVVLQDQPCRLSFEKLQTARIHEAGKNSRGNDGCRDYCHPDNAECPANSRMIVICSVILQFGVVDEVYGIVYCHTQHHRNDAGGHHVERNARPAHVSTHADCRK